MHHTGTGSSWGQSAKEVPRTESGCIMAKIGAATDMYILAKRQLEEDALSFQFKFGEPFRIVPSRRSSTTCQQNGSIVNNVSFSICQACIINIHQQHVLPRLWKPKSRSGCSIWAQFLTCVHDRKGAFHYEKMKNTNPTRAVQFKIKISRTSAS